MVHLEAREIPVPTSVSPEAQSVLAMGRLGPPPRALPALDDVTGWKAYVTEADDFVRSMMGDATARFEGSIEERDIGPCPLYMVTPDGVAQSDRRRPRWRLGPWRRRPVQKDSDRLGQHNGDQRLVGGLQDAP